MKLPIEVDILFVLYIYVLIMIVSYPFRHKKIEDKKKKDLKVNKRTIILEEGVVAEMNRLATDGWLEARKT